jgi:hypothetical protein
MLLIAGTIEFGNGEVYYWLYALHPDISHFDHPPMIGFLFNYVRLIYISADNYRFDWQPSFPLQFLCYSFIRLQTYYQGAKMDFSRFVCTN